MLLFRYGKIYQAARSRLQVHLAQQGVVARVGVQGIIQRLDGKHKDRAVVLIDRFIKPVESSVDFSQSKMDNCEAQR